MSKKTSSISRTKGQSFVELAIVLPLLLFLLIAFVEVGAIVYTYLSLLDVVREAARFASEHDPTMLDAPGSGLPISACEDGPSSLHFYYDTACVIISDLDPTGYQGFNPDISLNPATDDVTISVFTIAGNTVTDRLPGLPDTDGVWSLYSENWTKNCDGTLRSTTPFMQDSEVDNIIDLPTPTLGVGVDTPGPGTAYPSGPTEKGNVLVEVYFCHEQLLNLPLLNDLLPNPIPLHAYAFMPAPAAAPTATPLP